MKFVRLSTSLCLILTALGGCDSKSKQEPTQERNGKPQPGKIMRAQTKITSVYDNVENENLPAVVPFNDEQREYIIELLSAVLRVMEGKSNLEAEERTILGDGQFFWPKDPAKPIKTLRYYTYDNFRVRGITLSFERKDVHSFWHRAGLGVHPRNFPTGVYDLRLPPSVFQEFQLVRSVQETRPGESIYRPVVFYFSHRSVQDLSLVVEARPDVAAIDNSYPRTFHGIEIIRGTIP